VAQPDNVYVAEFTTNGQFSADQVGGGAGMDWVLGLAANANGQVAIVGEYTQPLTFGNLPPTTLNGTLSYFVAQLSTSSATPTPSPSPSPTPSPTPTPSPSSTPSPSPSPTPISTPTPTPVLIGDLTTFSGRGKHRKVSGVRLLYSGALDFGSAQNTGSYRVTQSITRRKVKVVAVEAASYNPGDNSVTLFLGKSQKGKTLQLIVDGVRGGNGSAMSESVIDL
jgi:hypothetical protein